jgi:excisionase family DNA binding protein
MDDGGITIDQAAARLGVSERTIHRRIKEGKIQAHKVGTPRGDVWCVHLHGSAVIHDSTQQPVSMTGDTAAVKHDSRAAPEVLERALDLVERMHEDQRSEIDRLRQENDRLFEAARVWQARAMQLETEIRLLMAPKDEPTDVTPQEAPTQADSGPDWQAIAQALEERVKRLEKPPVEPEQIRPWWKRLFG